MSKCLDNSNITPDERKEILNREMEVLKMIGEKDTEIRKQEMALVCMAEKKDTEKKEFSGKTLGAASFVVLAVAGIGAAALGGKVDIKPLKRK